MAKALLETKGQRLCIYIDESDRWRGKPLYSAILETLKTEGLAGATVLRGVAGFGAHSYIRTASIVRLSEDLPLRIEVIDSHEKIAHAIEVVVPMVSEGLITVDELQVIKYTHRYLNPIPADRQVEEVMTREVVTLTPDMRASDAWRRMQEHLLKALPVIDANGMPVGMLTDDDLLDRSGVQQQLEGEVLLDEVLLRLALEELEKAELVVGELMTQPVITALFSEPLATAAARMAKGGIKRLPVVDKAGKLVGVLSRVDILQQVAEYRPTGKREKVPLGAAVTVREIMDTRLPAVNQDARLLEIVEALLEFNTRCLIVVNDKGQVSGLINDAEVVRRVQPPERRGLLRALQGAIPPPPISIQAHEIMSPDVLKSSPDASLVEAARLMVVEGRKWLVVVDDQEKPLGLVDRQILLRAITGV